MRYAVGLAAIAFAIPAAALAQEAPVEEQYVCTAEQAFGPLLGRLLPITISREQAPLFGLDPDECQTPVGQF